MQVAVSPLNVEEPSIQRKRVIVVEKSDVPRAAVGQGGKTFREGKRWQPQSKEEYAARQRIDPALIVQFAKVTRYMPPAKKHLVGHGLYNLIRSIPAQSEPWQRSRIIKSIKTLTKAADEHVAPDFGTPSHHGLQYLQRLLEAFKLGLYEPDSTAVDKLKKMAVFKKSLERLVQVLTAMLKRHPEFCLSGEELAGMAPYPGARHFNPRVNPVMLSWRDATNEQSLTHQTIQETLLIAAALQDLMSPVTNNVVGTEGVVEGDGLSAQGDPGHSSPDPIPDPSINP
ncbi:hypothetical protein [Hydrogenophaga defluvii]|uniref:Uncharacterized protein n=1 Tax=Hydrogenophaga defluvii TaxID=249410 RepID=A0ABW2SC34_9BURK